MVFQHNSNGGGNSGILPKTKLSAKKASMPSSLLEEAGLCADTFDGVETVVGDFCALAVTLTLSETTLLSFSTLETLLPNPLDLAIGEEPNKTPPSADGWLLGATLGKPVACPVLLFI